MTSKTFATGTVIDSAWLNDVNGITYGLKTSATGNAIVTTALGFTPYNATNPSGYITSITGTMVTNALGFTPYNATNPSGYITGVNSTMITTALGYTPYNSSNPSGYITSAALSAYLPLSGGTISGTTTLNNSIGLYAKESGGTARNILSMGSDNNIYTFMGSGGNYFWYNTVGGLLMSLNGSGTVQAGNFNATSDERKKEDWVATDESLITYLAGLEKAGTFAWKDTKERSLGVGAQSLEAFLPEAVHTDEHGVKSVNYGGAAMVAVVELSKLVLQLQEEIKQLKGTA